MITKSRYRSPGSIGLKPRAFEYAAPASVTGAIELLAAHGDQARPIAGGQSLVPLLNFRLAVPKLLVDLNGIASLRGLRCLDDGSIEAGAMVRHREFECSPLIAEALPLVACGVRHIAHVGIRNRGTIGGSMAHADPAAEWPALAIACDAQIRVAGPSGERTVAAVDFFPGLFATALAPGEIVVAIRFPRWPAHRRWGFQEFARRTGDFALAGVAATVDFDAAQRCTVTKLVAFGVADRPILLPGSGEMLAGTWPAPAAIAAVAARAAAGAEPRADPHASATYRSELLEVMVRHALGAALGWHGGRPR